ncbi:MAG TPA: nuclear transport factor 2 family protein [Ktedonobacterales bacterium]|jgi:ketosteroid isomerase-like protein|nr:nuclear transport factor 2 family protein [Ktedonobacterales bacterium]
MDVSSDSSLIEAMERIRQATNHHDLDELAACFAPDYQSMFPVHPDRAFGGREKMRENWARIFHAVPDIRAELLRTATNGDTIWAEWEWTGTLASGGLFLNRGVTIHGIEHGMTTWVRLYMEPVREGEPGIEQLERSNHP